MESNKDIIRKASHYNSWYMGPEETLKKELDSYLEKAEISNQKENIKAIIVPHAGIMWSGPTAAWGFKNLIDSNFKKIFILGPSHFMKFKGCALSIASHWETPFCNLRVDREIIDSLKNQSKAFVDLPLELDEYEHSLELQIPYLGYIYKDKVKDISIIPIMCGWLSLEEEVEFAKILLPYYKDKDNVFVVSEDFCHWGPRHNFWYHEPEKHGEIHQSIEYLDNLAFESIKKQNAKDFKDYLATWKNNLCGNASPVTVFVAMMELANKEKITNEIDFVYYTKSNPKIKEKTEESVSYAVGINYLK